MCGAVVMVAEVKLDGAGILSLSAGVSFALHLFLGRVQLCFFVLSSARSHHPRLSFAVLMQIVSETLATLLFTQHSCLLSFTISCESHLVSHILDRTTTAPRNPTTAAGLAIGGLSV